MKRGTTKSKYRPLTISERDMLFALYHRHNGNILAMTRDADCIIKGKNQLYYYRDLYHFSDELGKFREKRAKEITSLLYDAKILALEQVIKLVNVRHEPLKAKDGSILLDTDGQPIWIEINPDYKEIETAWKIIKTELGEPISVSSQHITSKNEAIVQTPEGIELANKALDAFLNKEHLNYSRLTSKVN